MAMNTFNSNNFIKALKESYEAIPYIQGDGAAKKMVADSIKSNGYNPEDVFSFIFSKMGASCSLSEGDWKKVIETAIKSGGFFGLCLKEYKTTLKGKLSYEEMFKLAASCCGINPMLLSQEYSLDKLDWTNVVRELIKTPVETKEEKKAETTVVRPAATKVEKKVAAKKIATKSINPDPRNKSITLVCEKTGEVKTWPSYRACEKELYGDPKKGHGTVSQLLNPKKGLKHLPGGWTLPKEEKAPVKAHKLSGKRGVVQMKRDKKGNLKVVKTFSSITEASQVTGISHSGIS